MTTKMWGVGQKRRYLTSAKETHARGYRTYRDHPLAVAWVCMMKRCYDPNHNRFKNYGGRGIDVVPRWWDFWRFVDDMEPKPPEVSRARKDRYTLSWPDHNQDYGPHNCEWLLPHDHYSKKKKAA